MAYAQGLDGIQMRGINDLALNYSKQQLAHLVQIGQLDPAKAMLAGMAIDRVKANAEKPPTATVFDDVLGQQAQQPQDMSGIASMAPQQGQQPQPEQMPQEGAGVSALPSGIEGMADGGIVGYADKGLVEEKTSSPIGRAISGFFGVSPENQAAMEAQRALDAQIRAKTVEVNRLGGLGFSQQTPAERAEYERAQKELESLYEAKRQQGAKKPAAKPPAPAAPAGGPATFDPATGGGDPVQQRIFAQERAGLVAAIAAEKNPANKARLQEDLAAIDREIAGLSKQSKTQPYPDGTGGRKDSIPNPFAPPSAGGAGAAPASPYDLPALSDPRYKVDVPIAPMDKPKVRSVAEITAEKTAEEQKAGVEDVYSKMIKGISEKREDLAGRKGEAIGEAIMMAGFKLMGARKGQEFKALSEGAQEGLKQYAANMKEVKALQDKYDERMDAYRLAENEAKRTGVTSALATVEKEKDRLQTVENELFKAKNRASEVGATLGAGLKEADIRTMAALFGAQARAGVTEEEITNAAIKDLRERGKNKFTDEEMAEAKERIRRAYGMTGNYVAPPPSGERIVQKYGNVPKPAGTQ